MGVRRVASLQQKGQRQLGQVGECHPPKERGYALKRSCLGLYLAPRAASRSRQPGAGAHSLVAGDDGLAWMATCLCALRCRVLYDVCHGTTLMGLVSYVMVVLAAADAPSRAFVY